MRYVDITFTVDRDELTQEQYDQLITDIGYLMLLGGVGDINTMTYDDQMMKNLGVTP